MVKAFAKLCDIKALSKRLKSLWESRFLLRITKTYFILIFVNITCQVVQTSSILPHFAHTAIAGAQIVISIYISYRFGYAGMLYSILSNTQDFIFFMMKRQETGNDYFIDIGLFRFATIMTSIVIAFMTVQEKKYTKRLEWLSVVDSLTETYNHGYFKTKLDEEMTRAEKNNHSLGMIMIDIDYFKKYNDKYGHKEGDELLKKAADIFKAETGSKDIVCRYGGDEFSILLPETNFEGILSTIERIRGAFDKLMLPDANGTTKEKVTFSMGYSIYPNSAATKDLLVSQADVALYQAKNLGRNNVQLYRDVFDDIKQFLYDDEHELIGGLKALLGTVSIRDRYTFGHSERVLDYAVMIGKAMELSDERMRILKIAALLHDIGKIEIPKHVLNKVEPLTDEEFALIRRHPDYSVDILEPLKNMELLIEIVKYHHERFDGKGYPDKITGEEIPLEARILTVADSFDAMLSNRPYKRSLSLEEAVNELKRCSGSQFDPKVVQAFFRILNS